MRLLSACLLIAQTPAVDEPATFTKDVAPILWKHCAGCHRPGEVGPFPLLSYRDAAKRAELLKDVVEHRAMPPWKAEPGYGHFLDERRLTDQEIATIARWADDGAEEGDPKDLPPPPRFSDGWQLGEPDLVLEMPEAFDVPASGEDVFRCFVIPTGLLEDRAVTAIEFRPGNRRVVHHALFFLDSRGQARARDAEDPGPGFASFGGPGFLPTGALGGWAPGTGPRPLPDGVARLLPKGSDLVLQVHYHPSGKPETDRSRVGLHFADKKPDALRILTAIALVRRDFAIPAGASDYVIRPEPLVLPVDVHAIGITPHMHWIGRQMKVRAIKPDGAEVPLIWIKAWDFNWQGQYLFAEPVALPKGTRIEVEATYDNSAANPRNPSRPPRTVTFGEQTEDEMCLCALQVVPDEASGYAALRRAMVGYLLRAGRGRAGLR
jgi:hypothetical protein